MTRQFTAQYHCNNCKTWQTQETIFGRWIRNNKALDSAKGYCVIDQDYFVHQFKSFENRDFQLIMMVEIKTMGMEPTQAQKDTLHILNQLLRNERATPTKALSSYQAVGFVDAFSVMNGRRVKVKAYGAHVLRFSGLGPDDSDAIFWDKKQIDVETLTKLLRFDIHPDTFLPIDLRNHHRTAYKKNIHLFDGLTA